jgi:hypothetical protein
MNKLEKRRIFSIIESRFETERVKLYFLDMAETMPDYIFTMPSSTSGKYHNATQCQKFGQLYHEFMFGSILEHRLRLKTNKEKFSTPELRDLMRCVPFFHDAIKCGLNGSTFTVHEHPMLAGEWVRNTIVEHDILQDEKEIIARMCERHSGEWTTARRGSKVVLPEPETEAEFFIHECDILSSRNDIDMIIPVELTNVLNCTESTVNEKESVDINTYSITFGKYKGQLITEIAKDHKDYLQWMKGNLRLQEPLKTFVDELLK